MPYEVIDHTADLAIRVVAKDLKLLFEDAVRAVVDIMGARADVPRETIDVFVDGIDMNDALVRWLQEIIYRVDAEGFRLFDVTVNLIEGSQAYGIITGDYLFSELDTAIKAATYHGLSIEKIGGLYKATITFDT